VFIVADGMGGHAAGDVASRLAIQQFEPLVGCTVLAIHEVMATLEQINNSILAKIDQDATKAGMGTTLTGMLLVQVGGIDHWVVFNIGDSRVYRITDHTLHQVTTDHSEVQELVAAGKLSPLEAKTYPHRNIITRALGSLPAPQVDTWIFPTSNIDRFIICSDGLTNEVDDQSILALSDLLDDPQELADSLVDAANRAGGHDNITVIVVDNTVDSIDTTQGNTIPKRSN
jgi:protein phosphatase